MTAMPLQQQEQNEDGLKQNHRANSQNLPTIHFPGGGWPEIDAALRWQVVLVYSPTLHLPPVEPRRRIFDGWGLDVARLFAVKDANGNSRGYLASLIDGEHRSADDCRPEKGIVVGKNRRVRRGVEFVQRIAGLMRSARRIDVHQMPEDCAMGRKVCCVLENILE